MLSELAAGWSGSKLLTRAVDRAGAFLRERLVGAELALGWIHGDFWPGNLLADTRTGTLAGIVDWDRSSSEDVPLHDLLHLLAYSRKLLANRELGEIVVECLLPAAFDARERALVDLAMESLALPRDPEFLRAMALLYWTRFAATNLTRYPRYRRDGRWLRKNVFLVLERNAQ
jgi:aminoglycoside phosphotransferase (APT) family kinase protein